MGCRAKRPQEELLRVIRRSDGTLDIGRTLPGRGAWLCPTSECLDLAVRRNAFPKAFRQELAAGAADALRARMDKPNTEEDGRA